MANPPLKSFVAPQHSKDNIPKAIFKTLLKEKKPLNIESFQNFINAESIEISKTLNNLTENLKLLKKVFEDPSKPCNYFFIDEIGGCGE